MENINNSNESLGLLESSMLASFITQLPDNLRIAFILHDIKGKSYLSIANILFIKEAEVRGLVHKARLQIRQIWRKT